MYILIMWTFYTDLVPTLPIFHLKLPQFITTAWALVIKNINNIQI